MVRVQSDFKVAADAVGKLLKIICEESLGLSNSDGLSTVDIGAGVSPTNGEDASGADVSGESEPLELLDESLGASHVPSLLSSLFWMKSFSTIEFMPFPPTGSSAMRVTSFRMVLDLLSISLANPSNLMGIWMSVNGIRMEEATASTLSGLTMDSVPSS